MRQMRRAALAALALQAIAAAPLVRWTAAAHAQGAGPIVITLENDRFVPAEVIVPSGKRLQLRIINKSAAAIEFEAKDLKVERVLPARSEATIAVRPLKPGKYLFVNEFKEDVVKGYLIAK